jgi:hypothetical protein
MVRRVSRMPPKHAEEPSPSQRNKPGEADRLGLGGYRGVYFVGREHLVPGLEHAHPDAAISQPQPGEDVGGEVVCSDDDLVATPQVEAIGDQVPAVRCAVGEDDFTLGRSTRARRCRSRSGTSVNRSALARASGCSFHSIASDSARAARLGSRLWWAV